MKRASWAGVLLLLCSCSRRDDPAALAALEPHFIFCVDKDGQVTVASPAAAVENARVLSDADLAYLKRFPRLESLALGYFPITDAGLRHVGELKQLQYLSIEECAISGAGLKHLYRLRRLTEIKIYQTSVTEADLRKLREALPEAEINGKKRGER